MRFWDLAPSQAFAAGPGASGCVERLLRTPEEQVAPVRIFQDVGGVRRAVRAFAARHGAEWLTGKNGHRSPADMRAAQPNLLGREAGAIGLES